MIIYKNGKWGIRLLFRLTGSVAPKALAWAIPSAFFAIVMHGLLRMDIHDAVETDLGHGIQIGISGLYSAIGFLLVFRTQQAYARWWEGGTLLQTVRGEWFNAYSSVLIFLSVEKEKADEVKNFQHLLLRLMSLMYCAALQQVSTSRSKMFEIINLDGMEVERMKLLQNSRDRCEIILHWVQQHIVSGRRNGVVQIEAPLMAFVFQQLSAGIVNIDDARKIREFPFPFPYAQMMTGILVIHWLLTPVLMSFLCEHWWWAGLLTGLNVFCFWGMNYVATVMESPFGDAKNDLPLLEMQKEFNNSLTSLLAKGARNPPRFNFSQGLHSAVRVQNVDNKDFANPAHLKASAHVTSDVKGASDRVLVVLRNLTMDFEGPPPELPELAINRTVSRKSIRSLNKHLKTAASTVSSMESIPVPEPKPTISPCAARVPFTTADRTEPGRPDRGKPGDRTEPGRQDRAKPGGHHHYLVPGTGCVEESESGNGMPNPDRGRSPTGRGNPPVQPETAGREDPTSRDQVNDGWPDSRFNNARPFTTCCLSPSGKQDVIRRMTTGGDCDPPGRNSADDDGRRL